MALLFIETRPGTLRLTLQHADHAQRRSTTTGGGKVVDFGKRDFVRRLFVVRVFRVRAYFAVAPGISSWV